jgi:hypothetical protein
VALIIPGFLLSGATKGLAGKRDCPNRPVIRPTRKLQGEFPSANSRKQVDLVSPFKVFWLDIGNTPFIHITIGNQTSLD